MHKNTHSYNESLIFQDCRDTDQIIKMLDVYKFRSKLGITKIFRATSEIVSLIETSLVPLAKNVLRTH